MTNSKLRYAVCDLETSIYESFGRKANQFDPRNYIVANGVKYSDGRPTVLTHVLRDSELFPEGWLDNVDLLIGQNFKFDMLYFWSRQDFIAFLKRGGRIYDTMYAEYLLSGMINRFENGMAEGLDLNTLSAKYGGTQKIDIIKRDYWEKGIQTIDIPPDLLIEYLGGDLSNTEIVFLGQTEQSSNIGMEPCMYSHMEGLLGTTEMEFNGLTVDQEVAEEDLAKLLVEISKHEETLNKYIPTDLPEELVWNWGSGTHVSALLFGGELSYIKKDFIRDEAGEIVHTKATATGYVLLDGNVITEEEFNNLSDEVKEATVSVRKTGAKCGQYITKKIPALGVPKMKNFEFTHKLVGQTQPMVGWETKKEGVYKTDDKTKTILAAQGVEVAKHIRNLTKAKKLLGFYRYTDKSGEESGLLTKIQSDGRIHHKLHHCTTITGRLSSSDPNGQQLPRANTGDVRRMFSSRFGEDGRCIEADYSQLEVHGQAYLTGDYQMIQDVINRVDFHCKRLSFKMSEAYEDVVLKCKDENHPDHSMYKAFRTLAKFFSFQRAYGAGIATIAADLDMPVAEVQALADAEDALYPNIKVYNDANMVSIKSNAMETGESITKLNVNTNRFERFRVGKLVSVTGKRYSFTEGYAPQWLIDKKKRMNMERERKGMSALKIEYKNFKPTEVKNYPVQGFCGELMLMVTGVLFREFLKRDNFGGKAFLINTVHDCVWIDCHKSVHDQVCRLVKAVMESADKIMAKRYKITVDVPFYVEVESGANFYDLHNVPQEVFMKKVA